MKKKILLASISVLAVCAFGGLFGCSQKLDNPKYKIDDVVYLKPDSLKVIIIDDDVICGEYEIDYRDKGMFRQFCNEKDIYGKE